MKKKIIARSSDQTQISISMPVKLLQVLDTLAEREGRSRSNMIVKLINQVDEEMKRRERGS